MSKSSVTRVVWALGAILLICCAQFYVVQAQPRRGGEGARGGAFQPEQRGGGGRSGERGGGSPFEGRGGTPSQLPTRPGQGDPPGQGGAPTSNITVNHNHYYGGGNQAAYVAPGDDRSGAGYGAAPAPGYGGYGYPTGTAYNSYGPGTASINRAQAENMSIQNHNYSVQSYYQNQELHDQYVAAHREPTLTREQQEQLANEMSPGRLSPEQIDRSTNVINWPQLLRGSTFTVERNKIDHLFDERTASDSGIDSQSYADIKAACDQMKQTLVQKLRSDTDLPAVSFCAMDHFIRSVAYEASFSVH